jgi:hypothetical protein
MPLPNELEPKQPESKVEIALQKVKESKKKQPIVIEYETDDDEPEYTIEPIRAIQPVPVLPPPPLEVVKEEPPVKKEKRKYTKKVKPPPVEPTQPAQPSFNPLDIYKQLDTLKRENDRLKTEQSLGHINRLNNMARVMKIKF